MTYPDYLYIAAKMLYQKDPKDLPIGLVNLLDEADRRIRTAQTYGALRSTQTIAAIIALWDMKNENKLK